MVLIRHGEAVCNVSGVCGGVVGCRGLTGAGREQVDALARRLAQSGELAGADALYASILPRAIETAERLAPALAATGPDASPRPEPAAGDRVPTSASSTPVRPTACRGTSSAPGSVPSTGTPTPTGPSPRAGRAGPDSYAGWTPLSTPWRPGTRANWWWWPPTPGSSRRRCWPSSRWPGAGTGPGSGCVPPMPRSPPGRSSGGRWLLLGYNDVAPVTRRRTGGRPDPVQQA